MGQRTGLPLSMKVDSMREVPYDNPTGEVARSKHVRNIVRDGWAGELTEVNRQDIVYVLTTNGGISEHITSIQETLVCGCRAEVGGTCSQCLGKICPRCFRHCAKCDAALGPCCWEKNLDDCGHEIFLCPQHGEALRESRFWLAVVSPFYGPRK